ncbi:heavy-metal-associated domain-containing protein [Hydrogenoanaerobacterium saccharovorans]|uniref:Heavy-metal-associated domain-containing protein n=1 Tax=Hydrogenoanaerobacterium saccharovorans TaxID=474960 RepID=A0A1H8DQN9_9FIRM|nr:heavy metal-associated domain-containing protein [Hydrogenoanaerobacterium saccharovorans]RPF42338.1 heavy-metal-associated domain-containing protein [Hydrogenoanaerobacterium saccharovorans]SEN09533.1 Heavy-metal-associated domain-containing protein [Hydrogenoanaerobacterium saccharovorans]
MSKESAYFSLNDVRGKRDVAELKRELDAFPGVISVSVNANENELAVDYDNTGVNQEQLANRLIKLGYEIRADKTEKHIM